MVISCLWVQLVYFRRRRTFIMVWGLLADVVMLLSRLAFSLGISPIGLCITDKGFCGASHLGWDALTSSRIDLLAVLKLGWKMMLIENSRLFLGSIVSSWKRPCKGQRIRRRRLNMENKTGNSSQAVRTMVGIFYEVKNCTYEFGSRQ